VVQRTIFYEYRGRGSEKGGNEEGKRKDFGSVPGGVGKGRMGWDRLY
jgi:hypothetical protein